MPLAGTSCCRTLFVFIIIEVFQVVSSSCLCGISYSTPDVSREAEIRVYAASLQSQNIRLSVNYTGCATDVGIYLLIAVSRLHYTDPICVDGQHDGVSPKYQCSWKKIDYCHYTEIFVIVNYSVNDSGKYCFQTEPRYGSSLPTDRGERVCPFNLNILRWPDIIDVDVQRGEAPISHSIIVWTIENYSDYLQRIFTKEDGVTNIDPYQAGFKLTVVSFRPPAVIKLSLPIFFSGRVVLFVSFNRSVSTDDTGFTPVCSESPQVIPSLPCISEVLLQNGATPFNPSTVVWTIQNYSDCLLLSFTKDDEGNINPNQHSYHLKREPRQDPSIADIRLTLPVFFDGRIKLTVHYNESAYAGFTPISMESPLVTTSKLIGAIAGIVLAVCIVTLVGIVILAVSAYKCWKNFPRKHHSHLIESGYYVTSTPTPQHSPSGADLEVYRIVSDLQQEIDRNVKPLTLLPLLRSEHVVSQEEFESINRIDLNRHQRILCITDAIVSKGRDALDGFIAALRREREHPPHLRLAEKLKRALNGFYTSVSVRYSMVDNVISPYLPTLVDSVNPLVLLKHLRKHQLVTSEEEDHLTNPCLTTAARNRYMFCRLHCCGPDAVKKFIYCLIEEETHPPHRELARLLIRHMSELEQHQDLVHVLEWALDEAGARTYQPLLC